MMCSSAAISARRVSRSRRPGRRGRRDAENAACAVAALGQVAHGRARLQKAPPTFPGLPHRMEEVGRRGGVLFISDSKAPHAGAAEDALSSFEPVLRVAGGKAK